MQIFIFFEKIVQLFDDLKIYSVRKPSKMKQNKILMRLHTHTYKHILYKHQQLNNITEKNQICKKR